MTHRPLILCLFVTIMTNVLLASQSMVSIGGWVQPKTQPDIKSNQFVFIDFWATWCGPCIKAMEHIEELKKVTDDKVFFISLSNEPFNTVDQFLERKGIKSTVAIDYENATFNTFNIESLPQGVLIAPDGSIVWKGMPSEMSFDKIKSIIRTYYKPIPVKKKLKSFNIKPARSQQIVIKKNKFQDIIIQWGIVNEPVEFYKGSDSNTIKYTGTLAQILADIWHIPQNAISISPDIMLAPSYTFEFIPTQNSSHHDLSS